MLIYQYYCPDCERTIAERDSRETCRCCGGKVKLTKMIQRNMSPIKENAHKTVYSRALAIDPSQVEEAVRLHPDEEYVVNKKEGLAYMVIKGAHHQEQMAARHGMVVYSGADFQKQNFGMTQKQRERMN